MRIALTALPLLLVLCVPALARPRDEVMINAYRCAAQSSLRVWLDCYYGAAQPQRAALGLAPAPAAQLRLAREPPAFGVPEAMPVRDAVMGEAGRCAGVAADRPWLDCYYAAANPARAELGLALVPEAAPPVEARAVPPSSHRKPGILGTVFGTGEVEAVSRMTNYHIGRDGLFTVALENGQVWQQSDNDGHPVHWSKPPQSYVVTITGGALNSFNLSVNGAAPVYKVRRLS